MICSHDPALRHLLCHKSIIAFRHRCVRKLNETVVDRVLPPNPTCQNSIKQYYGYLWLLLWLSNHLEKWWSSSMGFGWHPVYEMEKTAMFETTNHIYTYIHTYTHWFWWLYNPIYIHIYIHTHSNTLNHLFMDMHPSKNSIASLDSQGSTGRWKHHRYLRFFSSQGYHMVLAISYSQVAACLSN